MSSVAICWQFCTSQEQIQILGIEFRRGLIKTNTFSTSNKWEIYILDCSCVITEHNVRPIIYEQIASVSVTRNQPLPLIHDTNRASGLIFRLLNLSLTYWLSNKCLLKWNRDGITHTPNNLSFASCITCAGAPRALSALIPPASLISGTSHRALLSSASVPSRAN